MWRNGMNERNAEIVRLWNLNITAQEIGKRLGVTRNTIIGVVTRARVLGHITRPMVMSASEKGRMGNIVKYGYKRKTKEKAK
jgi:DNA-binding CsgD family transcriptional regulator